jgi:hypothetical protein
MPFALWNAILTNVVIKTLLTLQCLKQNLIDLVGIYATPILILF